MYICKNFLYCKLLLLFNEYVEYLKTYCGEIVLQPLQEIVDILLLSMMSQKVSEQEG